MIRLFSALLQERSCMNMMSIRITSLYFLIQRIIISSCGNGKEQELNPTLANQSDSLTDSRDGQKYAIVTIGEQIWMAEDLRYHTPGSWSNINDSYGRFYDLATAQTVCPEGWHLPSDSEWNQLEMFLGMSAADTAKIGWRGTHAEQLKSTTGWDDQGNGTNTPGFNAFPEGYFYAGKASGHDASVGYWSSTGEVRYLVGAKEGVNRYMGDSGQCFRCIKD